MQICKSISIPILFSIIFSFTVNAQQLREPNILANKLNWYGLKNRSPLLFLHFDKTVYSNNDNVWFTGYLLNTVNIQSYNTLSIALIKDDDRAVILDNKFLIKGGLVFGNIVIPNAAIPGNYSFVATTNRLKNGKPEVVFTQPITIKSEQTQDFTASLSPVDTSLTLPEQKIRLVTNFNNLTAGQPIPAIQVSYYLGSSVQPIIISYGETEAGKYDLTIPTNILKQGSNILHVQLWYKNDVKDLSLALPAHKQPALVSFYPEGGNMVTNLPNVIGVEIKTAGNDPLSAAATLYENDKPIQTFQTSGYGMGRFTLIPKANANYWVKLNGQADTAYSLPKAIRTGPTLNLKKALANDTLDVELHNAKPEKLYLQVHNFKKLIFSVPLITGKNTHLKILLDSVPKGLNQLTLTDSLGRPFAERMFFAHYSKKPAIQIKTDQPTYGTRKKVTVKIKLNDTIADRALVSIAVVQASRIEIKKQQDIESYVYLKNDLGELPLKERYLGDAEADKHYLEAALLIKGWRRYTWTDVLKTVVTDTVIKYTDAIIKGRVVQFTNQPIKKPVSLINLKYPLDIITTNTKGMFELNNVHLIADSGRKAGIIITEKRPELFNIRLNNPYAILNEHFAVQLQPKEYFYKGQESTQYMQLPDNEHAILLKEVNIKGNNGNIGAYNKRGNDNENYVMTSVGTYNYGRDGEINAIVVNTYKTTEPTASYKLQLSGIYQAREFYPVDFSKNPSAEGFLSTLYWKHVTPLSTDKETELSFYTGDITGRFKIVVQGVAVNDVTYSEAEFNIIKPK